MIKAILFDLDNTLLDFVKMKKFATKAAARAMVKAGLKMSVLRLRHLVVVVVASLS